MHQTRPVRFLLTLFVLLALAPSLALAGAEAADEDWYLVNLSGQKAGWMYEKQSRNEQGHIVSESRMEFSVGRGEGAIGITIAATYIETPEGEPVEIAVRQKQGLMESLARYHFRDDGVLMKLTQAGNTTTKRIPPMEQEFLMPAAAERYVQQRLDEGARRIELWTIDATVGLQPMKVTRIIEGPTQVETVGKVMPAIEWKVRQSIFPTVVSTEYVDMDGELLRATSELPGSFAIEILATEEEVAKSPFAPPEIMASTLVRLEEPIANARKSTRGTYLLSVSSGEIDDIPEGGPQRTERLSESSVRVTVDLSSSAPAGSVDEQEHLRTTRSADHEDPKIRELVDRALDGVPADPAARAEALRRFVFEYIDTKDLGVGFATASEVCRTRQGDCSEHAVLLATMLRAAGIPSRSVSGLMYVEHFIGAEHVFGYHMWAQALLEVDGEERWVDLDAMLGPDTPFDATHIALSTSSLTDEDVFNSMVPATALIGVLEIDVESVE